MTSNRWNAWMAAGLFVAGTFGVAKISGGWASLGGEQQQAADSRGSAHLSVGFKPNSGANSEIDSKTNSLATTSREQMQGSGEGKTAEQQFKNIKVLKDIPAGQLMPSMQFMAASLGVECEFCHVEHQMEKDDKKPKEIARKMIGMELEINEENFDKRVEVTCYTCHRGAAKPVSVPAILADGAKAMRAPESPETDPANLPKPEQILQKYLAGVGGADALMKIKSRVQTGKISALGGQYPIEVYSEAPDKRVSITHPPSGSSVTGFNGQTGWMSIPNGVHRMSAAEGEAARIDADLYFPAHVASTYQEFRTGAGEKMDGHDTTLVSARAPGKPSLRMYFDAQSGLLLRLIRYLETPLGNLPTQVDYGDYREVDGVRIPFRWTLGRPSGSFTIQIDRVQQNTAVDEKLFVPPPEPAAH
jgi:photosynthetic reaction center cytochrome c subunit